MIESPKVGGQLRIAAMLLGAAALILAITLMAGPSDTRHYVRAWLGGNFAAPAAPPGFEEIVDQVKPAVFGVSTKVVEEQTDIDDPSLGEFFQEFGPSDEKPEGLDKSQDQPQVPKRPRLTRNEGSGFFISADGYAVTANHVIERGKSIKITTNEGTSYPVRLIGSDPETDIAVLKVDGKQSFPFVEIANRTPRIGEWVIAVGNPFGLGGTVTAGIVSAGGRDLMTESYSDFVQIDAPVNQGNSGGPTFDIRGKVIGVNSAIFSPTGGSVGIGFAIPAKTLRAVVPQLKTKGIVTRGWMGVQIQDVTPEIADSLSLKPARGALVAHAESDGPAAKAGVRPGDVVITIDGAPVRGDRQLAQVVSHTTPGRAIELGLIREGNAKKVKVTLAQHPGPSNKKPPEGTANEPQKPGGGSANLGVSLAPGDSLDPRAAGVVVTDVEPGGIAAERGLQPGDIILEVGGKAVKVPADVEKALKEARNGTRHNVLARVKSGDSTHFVAMPVG
ncbi:MAG: Do family serine endopeptidase [Methyloceanibacter sp.]